MIGRQVDEMGRLLSAYRTAVMDNAMRDGSDAEENAARDAILTYVDAELKAAKRKAIP